MSKYDDIQWVVQKNLSGEQTVEAMQAACANIGVDCHLFDIIPFSEELPDFPQGKRSIFYGSTTTMYLAYRNAEWQEGLFFDEAIFTIENYIGQWGKFMLNFGADILPVGNLKQLDYPADKLLFVRPNDDSKSFNGEVKQFGDIENWLEIVGRSEDLTLTADTKIVVGEPYQIEVEWRLWIVEGKVISASKYRQDFRLKPERGCPPEVAGFAEERCREYSPYPVFVMDIGRCGGNLYIIECGCMNSAGFYAADIEKIIAAVSAYFQGIVESG